MRHHSFLRYERNLDHAFAVWLDPRQRISAAKVDVPDRPKSPSLSNALNDEIFDLRTPPYYWVRAFHCSYDPGSAFRQKSRKPNSETAGDAATGVAKYSKNLPARTQSRFISAAHIGFENGYPLNSILTVNWAKLIGERSSFWLNLHPYDRAKALIEKIRKFLTRAKRRCRVAYIWVREAIPGKCEHLHVALHLPKKFRSEFLAFLARALGETASEHRRPPHERTKGEIACSASGSWHLGVEVCDASPEFSGYWLAAYLAKAEPSEREFRGRIVENSMKKERGKAFGGRIQGEKYDRSQGVIEGSPHRKGRYSISRSLRQ